MHGTSQQKYTDKLLAKTILPLLPRWVTPNHITISRFLSIPFVLILLIAERYSEGIFLFALSAFSDAVDGALARTKNMITDWGKMFDPLADKLLVGTTAAVVVTKFIGVYLTFTIITIELLLILNAYYKKKYQNTVVQAEITGKTKMILQSVGIVLLLSYAITSVPILLTTATWVLLVSIIFALWSLVVYRSI